MSFKRLLTAIALTSLLCSASIADDKIEKAIKKYEEEVEKEKAKVVKAFDREIAKHMKKGDIDEAQELSMKKESWLKTGEVDFGKDDEGSNKTKKLKFKKIDLKEWSALYSINNRWKGTGCSEQNVKKTDLGYVIQSTLPRHGNLCHKTVVEGDFVIHAIFEVASDENDTEVSFGIREDRRGKYPSSCGAAHIRSKATRMAVIIQREGEDLKCTLNGKEENFIFSNNNASINGNFYISFPQHVTVTLNSFLAYVRKK